MQSRSLLAGLVALLVVSCKEQKAAPAAAPAAVKPAATSPALPLGEKLDYEAAHRPAIRVTADKVYGALEAAGVALTEKRQHVAAAFLARYCLGALGPSNVAFSVCEFETADGAAAGKKESETALASVPNRTLVLNAETVLTVREPDPPTPESAELRKKVVALFEKL